jgi:sugar phosphate isomerase/epimerase
VAHPNLRFTLDVIHAQLSGCLDAFLDVLGDAIVNLHLADLVPPAQRVPPGDGILCWEELVPRFRCLPNLQQATVELAGAGPEEVARAVDFLRACWGSPLP